jgi:hypothetical protein
MSVRQWTNEDLHACFEQEIRDRFARENAEYRALETAELAKLVAKEGERVLAIPGMEVHDSFLWRLFEGCAFSFEQNQARVLLPEPYAITCDVIAMFDGTEAAWTRADIRAVLVDGVPHLQIYVLLVDYWDDDRSAAWRVENGGKRTWEPWIAEEAAK